MSEVSFNSYFRTGLEILGAILSGPIGCGTEYPDPPPPDPIPSPPEFQPPCSDLPENQSVSRLLETASFHDISFPARMGWPEQMIHVEAGLLSTPEEQQISQYMAAQSFVCGRDISRKLRREPPPPMESHHSFIVRDSFEFEGLPAQAPAAFFPSGEKIFRYPSGFDLLWKHAAEEEFESKCLEPLVAHELAHQFNAGSLIQLHPLRFLEEGLAEYLSLTQLTALPPSRWIEVPVQLGSEIYGTPVDFFSPSGEDKFQFYFTFDSQGDPSDPLLGNLNLRAWEDGELLATLFSPGILKGLDSFCQRIPAINPWPIWLQGGYLCFQLAEGSSGSVLVTEFGKDQKSYQCESGLLSEIHRLPVGSGEIEWIARQEASDVQPSSWWSYGTGYCFWEWIEDRYGEAAFLNGLQSLLVEGRSDSKVPSDILRILSSGVFHASVSMTAGTEMEIYGEILAKAEQITALSLPDGIPADLSVLICDPQTGH